MKKAVRFLPHIIVALPLLSHIILGTYNRALTDDFCLTLTAEHNGLWGNIYHWYNTWTGTYSSTFFQSAIGLMRAWQFVPSTVLILWFAGLVWLIYQFAQAFNLREKILSAVGLTVVVLYGVLAGTANVYQSFYWTSGTITYTLPLIVLTFVLGIIIYALRSNIQQIIPSVLLCAGGTLLAGGFAPFYATFQVVFFAVVWLGVRLFARDSWRNKGLVLFGVSFIFACIALGILLVAPGNALRREEFDLTLSFGEVILNTLFATFGLIPITMQYWSPLVFLVPLILSAMIAFLYHPLSPQQRVYFQRYSFRWMVLSLVIALIFVMTGFFTSLYSVNALPPPRAYVLLQLILVATACVWGYLMGLGLQKQVANQSNTVLRVVTQLGLLILLILGPLRTTYEILTRIPELSTFASEWDARDVQLKNEPSGEIKPLSVDLAHIAWLDPNESCLFNFYNSG